MPTCRFCGTDLHDTIIDLGTSPLSNAFVPRDRSGKFEIYYPLQLWICHGCGLVQLEEFSKPENIFSEYAYFSSFSQSWLEHAKRYVNHMMSNYGITPESQVIEIGSNDGYLLQFFKQNGVNPLGVDPSHNVAAVANRKGIQTEVAFFGVNKARELVSRGIRADLILGNNVIAHVPDINDFVEGFSIILKPDGIMTVEFPHLLNMLKDNQFDTIYHEHFSYYSLKTMQNILEYHGLKIFHVEELPTHGGSLRVYACKSTSSRKRTEEVDKILYKENEANIDRVESWKEFNQNVKDIKIDLLSFLIEARRNNKLVLGYGAAAKGNTLLNYSGIMADLLPAVADKNMYKQRCYLPGSRIPVITPDELIEKHPDYIFILPWNLKGEIIKQFSELKNNGVKFVTAIPELRVE